MGDKYVICHECGGMYGTKPLSAKGEPDETIPVEFCSDCPAHAGLYELNMGTRAMSTKATPPPSLPSS